METLTEVPEGVRQKIPLSLLDEVDNPRKKPHTEAYLHELANNIDAVDIIQDPTVEESANGRFTIRVGAGRVKAARLSKRYGPDGSIFAMVKNGMSRELAHAVSLSENIHRQAMDPVDEAEAAAKTLGQCKNDRAEAAKLLGWKPAMLDARLALMYAIEPVREALRAERIKLGHAELLAVTRKEWQQQGLSILLAQEKQMTVSEFKAHIDKAALQLDKAIFDRTECVACHHNSSNQKALFAESISEGKCSNKACFDQKTDEALQGKVASLQDEYQVVRIARPGENLTIIPLIADGPKGVGEEQAKACRVCQNFGAVVSGVPDKLGQIYTNMCMDVPCNTKMVAARINAEQPEAPGATSKEGRPAAASQAAGRKAEKSSAGKATTKPATSTYPQPSNRVKEYREKLWRLVYQRVVAGLDVPGNRSVLLAIALTSPGVVDKIALKEAIKPLVPKGTGTSQMGLALKVAREFTQEQLGQALMQIAASVTDSMPIADVVAVLKSFEVDLAGHWKVKKDFFELLTKNEIDAVCDEIGITAAMGAAYAKARNDGKDAYIKAVLGVKDFDYKGRVPKLVRW